MTIFAIFLLLIRQMRLSNLNTLLIANTVLASAPTVNIKNGTVEGVHLPSFNQDIFLGIPYAQPPTGTLRFAPPQPYNESWEGTFPADEYSPACWASAGTDTKHLEHSEDCLTINVVRPAGDYKDLPVGFWIHGGGFYDGSAARPAYNLSYIVDNAVAIGKPFIGVSINYRLNGFGFLSSEELSMRGWTNVGLRDQIQALNWARENIAAFGGDPDHIVIWGESAGAISVGKLITSQKVPFIKGAIMESGSGIMDGVDGANDNTYQENFDAVVEYFGCSEAVDAITCLQDIDEDDLIYAFNSTNGIMTHRSSMYPYIDGDVVPKSGYLSYVEGEFTKVPILIGTNTDEGTAFTSTDMQNQTAVYAALASAYPHLTNDSIERIYAYYTNESMPLSPLQPDYNPANTENITYTDVFRRMAAFTGDAYFIASARFVSQFHSEAGLNVYKYRHNIPNANGYNTSAIYGATHYTEVAYVFYTGGDLGFRDSSDGQQWWDDDRSEEISKTTSELWAAFITDLDPNNADCGLIWTPYGQEAKNMVIDINGFYQEQDDFREEGIELIREIHNQFHM